MKQMKNFGAGGELKDKLIRQGIEPCRNFYFICGKIFCEQWILLYKRLTRAEIKAYYYIKKVKGGFKMISAISLSNGDIVEKKENQFFQLSESEKSYELWDNTNGMLRLLKRFRRTNVLWVFE